MNLCKDDYYSNTTIVSINHNTALDKEFKNNIQIQLLFLLIMSFLP